MGNKKNVTVLKSKNALATLLATAMMLIGCTNYTPNTFPEGTVIPISSITLVSLNDDMTLIPNQQTDLDLVVTQLGEFEVKNVYITAQATVDLNAERALMNTHTLIVQANGKKQQLNFSGHVIGDDKLTGVSLHCDKGEFSDCGVYILKSGESWSIVNQEVVDISGVTVLIKPRKT